MKEKPGDVSENHGQNEVEEGFSESDQYSGGSGNSREKRRYPGEHSTEEHDTDGVVEGHHTVEIVDENSPFARSVRMMTTVAAGAVAMDMVPRSMAVLKSIPKRDRPAETKRKAKRASNSVRTRMDIPVCLSFVMLNSPPMVSAISPRAIFVIVERPGSILSPISPETDEPMSRPTKMYPVMAGSFRAAEFPGSAGHGCEKTGRHRSRGTKKTPSVATLRRFVRPGAN